MSEGIIGGLDAARWAPGSLLARDAVCHRWHATETIEWASLPIVQPGQLWFVESRVVDREMAPLEYRALTAANVIVYDRTLSATVAKFLPLGGYAEPAGPGDATLERCLRFVHDGWSVAHLLGPDRLSGCERTATVQRLAERMQSLKAPADLRVSIFVDAGGGAYLRREALLERLGDAVDAFGREPPPALTIVFNAVAVATAPQFSVASTNGLAG
jgi:hypothetical protein